MSSPGVIDLDRLLSPIAGDNPCGESLRWDPVYDEIKAARREDDKDALAGKGPAAGRLAGGRQQGVGGTRRAQQGPHAGGFPDRCAGAVARFRRAARRRARHQPSARQVLGRTASASRRRGPRAARRTDRLVDRGRPGCAPAQPGARRVARCRRVDGYVPSWSFWKSRYITPKGEKEVDAAYDARHLEAERRAKLFEQAVAATPLAYYVNLREDLGRLPRRAAAPRDVARSALWPAAPGTLALRQALEECGALVARIYKEKGGRDGTDAAADDRVPMNRPPSGYRCQQRSDPLARGCTAAARPKWLPTFAKPSRTARSRTSSGAPPPGDACRSRSSCTELVKDTTARDQIGELLGFTKRES